MTITQQAKEVADHLYDDGWPDTLTVATEIQKALTAQRNAALREAIKLCEERRNMLETSPYIIATQACIEVISALIKDEPVQDKAGVMSPELHRECVKGGGCL